ncbi:Pentatricopeptide repeat-containing protein At2g21090 [Linum grandiflorum]
MDYAIWYNDYEVLLWKLVSYYTEWEVTEFTVASVVSCCASFRGLGLVRQLHGVGLVLGLEWNVVLLNSVIDAYGKYGVPDVSFRVFSRMDERDVVSWTSMVAAYTRASRLDAAVSTFKQMPHRNTVARTSLMAGFAQNGQSERTLDLFKQMLEDGHCQEFQLR